MVLESIPQLIELADSVVLIEPLPKAAREVNPLECLSSARYVEECRFQAETEPTWHDLLYREASSRWTEVSTLDLDRLAYPTLPTCEAMVDGRPVWWDHQHITAEFAATWADPLYRELAAIGVVPPLE